VNRQDKAEEAVRKHFIEEMDDRTKSLRFCALFDLHFGPMGAEYYKDSHEFSDWPGYVSAVSELEAWAEGRIADVWVDLETMFVASLPPDNEEMLEEYRHFTTKQVAIAVFRELVTDGGMDI